MGGWTSTAQDALSLTRGNLFLIDWKGTVLSRIPPDLGRQISSVASSYKRHEEWPKTEALGKLYTVPQIRFGSFGSKKGQFKVPSGIAVENGTGEIFVTDAYNHRVQASTSPPNRLRSLFLAI